MKKILLILILVSYSLVTRSQTVNGYIVSDTGNLTIVKVWGTHYERGFAYGFLCSAGIMSMLNDYILPQFGTNLSLARMILQQGTSCVVDSAFYDEARGLLAGLDSAGQDVSSLTFWDVIISNCLLDFMSIAGMKSGESGMGCSSLLSWGSATAGTDLDGKSVISRHLDWTPDPTLINNQVMVIHIPSEASEQPWALIGFAGQISALSGINRHTGVFQHMMSDFSGNGMLYKGYEPIWFSLRKALELKDYNNDGVNNTRDMCDILSAQSNGCSDGYIITMLASANNTSSGDIAMIAETAPAAPYLVLRGNEFPDSISADNLYAANYEIKRNNHYHFCPRYLRTTHAVNTGIAIGSQRNWEILRDSSNSSSSNIQMMQYIPDDGTLNISVHKHGKPAYRNVPVTLNMNDLFTQNTSVTPGHADNKDFDLYPNPVISNLYIKIKNISESDFSIKIYDINGSETGMVFNKKGNSGQRIFQADASHLSSGIYTCRIVSDHLSITKKFVKAE
ncbi:MAG TPA: T9SS type A sorting domain-containing protein [Bacteroidales bacterium]|nr:T9SS type A sorting domain-containing protein [Bacteroidales bacterium]